MSDDELITRCRNLARGWRILTMTREDIAQEAIATGLQARAQGQDVDRAVNTRLNTLEVAGRRRRKRAATFTDLSEGGLDLADGKQGPVEQAIRHEVWERAERLCTPAEVRVLQLTRLGNTDAEIALALGVKVNTVQVRRCLALKKLREDQGR